MFRYFIMILVLYNVNYGQDSLFLVTTLVGGSGDDKLKLAKGAGDLNGDGYGDLIVSSSNSVFIYLGNSEFELKADHIFIIDDSLSWYNGFLCPGDVNNDGYDDFIIDKIRMDPYWKIHDFYLYFGGEQIDTIPQKILSSEWIDQLFSVNNEPLGDINGDGYNDFAIGSPYTWVGEGGFGRVYLYYGGERISSEPDTTLKSNLPSDFFGEAVAGIGDINNDGKDDFMIGAPSQPYSSPPSSGDSGRVYLYYGTDSNFFSVDTIIKEEKGRVFGSFIYFAGKLTETAGNLIIPEANFINIYFSIDSLISINGAKFGYGGFISAGSGGDINNDGYDDFLIGNTNYKNDASEMVGVANLYWGGAVLDTVVDYQIEGENHWDDFSRQMEIFGDFNGDNYDDLFIFAFKLGKFYLYSYKSISSIKSQPKSEYEDNYYLINNFPNPFNGQTKIEYTLPEISFIKLLIVDVRGAVVATLKNGLQTPGLQIAYWNGKNDFGNQVASGVYFLTMQATNNNMAPYTLSKKIVYVK